MTRGRKGLQLTPAQVADLYGQMRSWMQAHGYSVETLAAQSGYSREAVELYTGRHEEQRAPSAQFLGRLAALGFTRTLPDSPVSPHLALKSERARQADALLLFLARAGLASAQQLDRVVCHSASSTIRLLHQLLKAQLLARYRPRASADFPYVYYLTARGCKLAGEQLKHLLRPTHPRALFLEHDLDVSEFISQLVVHAGSALAEWQRHAAELGDSFHAGGREQRLVPDLYARLELPWGERSLLVEMDRATESYYEWLKKARAYHQYAQGPYQRKYGTERLLVCAVTRSLSQLQRIRRAWLHANAGVMLYVTTWQEIQTRGLLGDETWLRFNSGQRLGLCADAASVPLSPRTEWR